MYHILTCFLFLALYHYLQFFSKNPDHLRLMPFSHTTLFASSSLLHVLINLSVILSYLFEALELNSQSFSQFQILPLFWVTSTSRCVIHLVLRPSQCQWVTPLFTSTICFHSYYQNLVILTALESCIQVAHLKITFSSSNSLDELFPPWRFSGLLRDLPSHLSMLSFFTILLIHSLNSITLENTLLP